MMLINRVSIVIILIYLSACASNIKPQYTLTEPSGKSLSTAKEALPVESGWEFQFPKPYHVQKIVINHDGAFKEFGIYGKIEEIWQPLKSVDANSASSSEIQLNVTTDGIRLFPKPPNSGQIVFCEFHTGKSRIIRSIPLKRPPFLK